MLLTSGGVVNPSIENALVELLGKPIEESSGLFIPTAMWGMRQGPTAVWNSFQRTHGDQFCLGKLKSVEVLELSVLPSIERDWWVPRVQQADALLVEGGQALFLAYWMRQSGLADVLQTLPNLVWVGMSAGSMVMAPKIGEEFISWWPPEHEDCGLGMVDFAIFPHLDYPGFTDNVMPNAVKWQEKLGIPGYAMDDATAIKVVDGQVDVVSEGTWKLLGA